VSGRVAAGTLGETLMSHRVLTAVCAAALFALPAGCSAQVVEEDHKENLHVPNARSGEEKVPDVARAVRIILDKTNEFRRAEGRKEVAVKEKLHEAARYFAGFMAETGKYGHTADGNHPADRAKKYGYDYCIVLENIAYQYNSAGFSTEELGGKFFEGWKNSPGHRRNMLDADVTETAVAVARSEKTGYYYAVQMFGRPKSLAISFSVANNVGEEVRYKVGDQEFTLPPRYIRTHEVCRPPELTFTPPGEKSEPQAVKPAGGAHYAITRSDSGLRLKKED
jgi:uncharacterized protein YkwD